MGRHLQFAVPFTNTTMPIYAYRCTSCGHAKDVLRRMSDPPLSVCPACGAATFAKQVTAAGFQLKGSGWYVTDFRGDKSAKKPADAAAAPPTGDGAAKPFLERWMNEQVGWRGLFARLGAEAPRYSKLLPELPRLLHDALAARVAPLGAVPRDMDALAEELRHTNRLLRRVLYLALGFGVGLLATQFWLHWPRG
jgi:putative FmdB family regulatory protein